MTYINAVYFSNWSVYQPKHFPLDLNTEELTHVFYAFMKIDTVSGAVTLSDTWGDIEMPMGNLKGALGQLNDLRAENRNFKLVMSIGGWGTADAFRLVMSNGNRTSTFVETAAELLRKYRFNGIDIDWEYPNSPVEGSQLVELLQKLRAKLDTIDPSLLLTVAAPASDHHLVHLHVSQMDQYLSFWNVMCYDFSGSSWSSKSGYHSNLYGHNGDNDINADGVILAYIRLGVSPQKLVLGMPLYGRSFYAPEHPEVGVRFNKDQPFESDIQDYRDIPFGDEHYDPRRVAAYSYDETKKLLVTYDNPECSKAKADYVKERKLGGGFWWDSKGDSKDNGRNLIHTFVKQLGGPQVLEKPSN